MFFFLNFFKYILFKNLRKAHFDCNNFREKKSSNNK